MSSPKPRVVFSSDNHKTLVVYLTIRESYTYCNIQIIFYIIVLCSSTQLEVFADTLRSSLPWSFQPAIQRNHYGHCKKCRSTIDEIEHCTLRIEKRKLNTEPHLSAKPIWWLQRGQSGIAGCPILSCPAMKSSLRHQAPRHAENFYFEAPITRKRLLQWVETSICIHQRQELFSP